MKCSKCGKEIKEDDMFCPNCGEMVKNLKDNNANNSNMYAYERPVNQQVNYANYQSTEQQSNYNQQYKQNYKQQYKNNDVKYMVKIFLIALMGTIIVGGSILAIYSMFTSKNKKSNSSNNNNGIQINNETSNSTNIDNDSQTPNSVSNKKDSSYKVKYAGFRLYIPDTLVYEMNNTDDTIMLGDSESTWVAELMIQQGNFQQLKQNKSAISSYFSEKSSEYAMTVSSPVIETIGGVEYILLECNMSGTNMLIGYAGLNSMYSACFQIYNEDNDFNREMIRNISAIISNAEYIGDSTNLEINKGIKFTDITNATNKALK